MSSSPISILSQTDFNGDPLDPDLLRRTFAQLMDEHGYVLMVNVPDDFDQVKFCRSLGSFVPNYTGAVVGDVRPEPGMDDVYHAGNTRPLTPHSEGYDFTVVPPRYIALWCVSPASGPGGETTLADTAPWVAALSDDERSFLLDTEFEWKTTEGVNRLGLDLHTKHPILEEHEKGMIVRFSCNNLLRADDDPVVAIQDRWRDNFYDHQIAIDYHRNDVLVWNNWRLLHARNAFTDRSRHLRRIQVAG
ncbi:TauD/TfdA family dioxygenase [Dactylosporangium sp. NPDC050688]|uniref:TauD/TfdA family dioxygenase n=1 Tax=Dactylosporangium sp. NPDC050688 TaxID=3157217 RepID=UPI0033E8EAB7